MRIAGIFIAFILQMVHNGNRSREFIWQPGTGVQAQSVWGMPELEWTCCFPDPLKAHMKTTKAAWFGILTITAALAVQVQGQSFLTNGLVAYYPFTGNANDASGNGNNGTLNGADLKFSL